MEVEKAKELMELVNEYEKCYKICCDFQELISGKINVFSIKTKNGSMTFESSKMDGLGNKMLFELDCIVGDWLDKMEEKIKEFDQ